MLLWRNVAPCDKSPIKGKNRSCRTSLSAVDGSRTGRVAECSGERLTVNNMEWAITGMILAALSVGAVVLVFVIP